jgi:hypothetical protein
MLTARAIRALTLLLVLTFATWLLYTRAKFTMETAMNFFGKNWKTTAGGAATMGLGILSLFGVKLAGTGPIDPQTALAMITGGAGLLFAKDGNVTGGTVAQ